MYIVINMIITEINVLSIKAACEIMNILLDK